MRRRAASASQLVVELGRAFGGATKSALLKCLTKQPMTALASMKKLGLAAVIQRRLSWFKNAGFTP